MDEYTASYTQIQTIIKAAQSMKDCLICSICIDYFEKPVTLHCGHRFCHSCISEVANNDNVNCPLCNVKIQKRSIPEVSNKNIELCVAQFKTLVQAISDDSGIDVLVPYNTVRHTKESVLSKPKPITSRASEASTSSNGSANSKLHASGNSRKKSFAGKTKASRNTKNTLHKYLSSKSKCTPDEKIESQDKVENWLKYFEPENENNEAIHVPVNSTVEETDNKSTAYSVDEPSTSKIIRPVKQISEQPLPHTYPSTSKTKTKYEETELRIQEAEIMAKKKKLNESTEDKSALKTPSSVSAILHSDAHDWRRVKRMGKELQVKTFKSLNVSKEKSCSSIILDDTVPCNSTNNDSKNISKESDINVNSSNSIVTVKAKSHLQKSSKSKNMNELQDQSYNQRSIDSNDSQKEEIPSLTCLDSNQVNEIIGIQPAHDLQGPENSFNPQIQENQLLSEESSNLDSKSTIVNSLHSSSKYRLTLRKKSDSEDSKSTCSNLKTPDKIYQDDTVTPERPKKLSLRLQSSKPIESKTNPMKTPEKKQNLKSVDKSKPSGLINSKVVVFKKLGKICKKPKYTCFVKLGRLCPKVIASKSTIRIKSNEIQNFDLSWIKQNKQKDAQTTTKISPQCVMDTTSQTIQSMEIDDSLPNVNIITCQEEEMKNDSLPYDEAETENTNFEQMSSMSHFTPKHKTSTNQNERKVDKNNISKCKNREKGKSKIQDNNDVIIICSSDSEPTNVINQKMSKHPSTSKTDTSIRNIPSPSAESESSPLRIPHTTNVEVQSEGNEASPSYLTNYQNEMEEDKSTSSSRSSSPLKTSPLIKKRLHSESSNDEDDDDDVVSSIIGKWTSVKPVMKKQKVIEDIQENYKEEKSKLNQSENVNTDSDEKTLVEDGFMEANFAKPQRYLPINNSIDAKSSLSKIEKVHTINKLITLPSSLQSADLFDSNDQSISVKGESNKRLIEIASDNSSASTWNSNKENENLNQSLEAEESRLEKTIVDLVQFEENKPNTFVGSNDSNKENKTSNKTNTVTEENENLIDNKSNDLLDSYNIPDTLMNITQEQLALKMIEKDLMGIHNSTVKKTETKGYHENDKFSTPRRKDINLPTHNDDFDSENIDATPVVKRRKTISKCQNKTTVAEAMNSSNIFSPEKNLHLIPAVTPVRNRRTYPLCHSTPITNTSNSSDDSESEDKPMALLCTGLTLENIKIVQNFAKKFQATFLSTFQDDVTHVIVGTDAQTNVGQKTFKYIQGIAYKKYVINMKWIIDSLNANTVLNANNEKYDVLDLDSLECGSRRSRNRIVDVFNSFAIYCLGPFTSIPVHDLKSLLVSNGATVTSTVKELSFQKNKYKIVISEAEDLSPPTLAALKKIECAIVSFEWVVDCISQYQIVSLYRYLFETTPEEAIANGIPATFLKEDEDEEEIDE